MRLPHAATVLTAQVQAKYKNATAERVGEPDGFNVIRSVKFDKTSSKWLAKVLPQLDDPRIAGFTEKGGQVTVEFTGRTIADQRDQFALEDAELVSEQE